MALLCGPKKTVAGSISCGDRATATDHGRGSSRSVMLGWRYLELTVQRLHFSTFHDPPSLPSLPFYLITSSFHKRRTLCVFLPLCLKVPRPQPILKLKRSVLLPFVRRSTCVHRPRSTWSSPLNPQQWNCKHPNVMPSVLSNPRNKSNY